jgi:hypothetical protein
VYGHHVDRGKPCLFSVDHRCAIYRSRPQDPCRQFICGWLARNSPLPEWMRPDKSDLILLAANFSWRGLPVDVAVAVGEKPRAKALDWLKQFATARHRLLLYQSFEEWHAFGPRAFQAEMQDRISRGEQPWK